MSKIRSKTRPFVQMHTVYEKITVFSPSMLLKDFRRKTLVFATRNSRYFTHVLRTRNARFNELCYFNCECSTLSLCGF